MQTLMPVIDYLHNVTAVTLLVSCGAMRLLTQGSYPSSKPACLFVESSVRSLSLMAACLLTGFLAAGTARLCSGMTGEAIAALVLAAPVCAAVFFWFRAVLTLRRMKTEK
jgi:hypothetical protein